MRRRLINLTRLGDLLQTQPVIHALKERGEEIGLVCLENFTAAARLLRDVDHVASLPASAILAGLGQDWRVCADGLEAWVAGERAAFSADSTLNLTPTLGARLLSRLVQSGGQPDGFSLDEHGFGRNGSPWATYTQAVTLSRGCSPFNLVDSFRHMAGVGHVPARYELLPPPPGLAAAVREELATAARYQGFQAQTGFIAFQLGASNDARRWPTASFAALGRILQAQTALVPLLLGSAEESGLAERYRAHGGVGVDFTGRTDLPRLAAALTTSRLLVTNDTGTMHLAAGLGVPLLALFLATAQPWDTGPYRENLCCLEPRLDCHPCGFGTVCPHNGQCRASITPNAVAGLIATWLNSGCWQPHQAATKTARVWLTTRDEQGFLDLVSLSHDEESDRTGWIRAQRSFYRHFLDALTNAPEAPPNNSDPAKSAELPPMGTALSRSRKDRVLDRLTRADALLLLAGEQGRLLAARPVPRIRQAFLATCDRLGALFMEGVDFVPLSLLWRTMLQESAENWRDMLRFFTVLRHELAGLASSIR